MGKIKDYKEGSTRGKALSIPGSTYKNDALAQAWVDRRDLAMLAVWFDSHGIQIKTMTDLVRTCIIQMVEHAVSQGHIERIKYTSEAEDVLNSLFVNLSLNPKGRGDRNLLHNMMLDEVLKEEALGMRRDGTSPMDGIRANRYRRGVSKDDKRYRFEKEHGISASDVRPEDLEAAERALKSMSKTKEKSVHEMTLAEKIKAYPYDYNEDGTLKIDPRSVSKNYEKVVTTEPCVCEIEAEESDVKVGVGASSNNNNDRPRPLTDGELEAKERAIAEKDRLLSGDW